MAAAAAEAEKKGEGSTVSRGAAGERVVEDSGGGRRTIHLKSKDGKQHDVTEASARLSKTIAGMILAGGGGGGADQCIPTPDIDHDTLRVVMQYCDNLRCHRGRQLPRHRWPPRPHLQEGRRHDQGQDPRGDPQGVQHRQRPQ
jgi:hypothetical protein